ETAFVISRLRASQSGNAARGRITIGARLAERFLELLDHMRWRRQIRIAHAEINDVRSRVAGLRLGFVHLFEDVRWQTANAVKLFHRSNPKRLRSACAWSCPKTSFSHPKTKH